MTRSTPVVLDAAAVAERLPRLDVLAALRDMFGALASGSAVQPAQTLTPFPAGQGDFIAYLGVLAGQGVFGVKLSPYIVTPGRPIVTAWTQLMSMTTGEPLLLCDAGRLTVERTGGTTALALDCLANRGVRRLAIIGSGAVAEAHFRHVQRLRAWEEIAVWSPALARDAERARAWRALDGRIAVAADAQAACEDAEVVMLCTSSATPVIAPEWLIAAALVTSISTNAVRAHEVPPEFLREAEVYCDYRATTPASAGEMILAARDHGWDAGSIRGDLPELVAGTCPAPSGERPVFFRSIGLGLEDIAMAEALLRAA